MARPLAGLLAALAAGAAEAFTVQGPTGPVVWPQPLHWVLGSLRADVSPQAGFFQLATPGQRSPLLEEAFRRYQGLTFPHAAPVGQPQPQGLQALLVQVESLAEDHPTLDTNESYTLNVTVGGNSTLSAKTVYGALRGLETFSQLVVFNFDRGVYEILGAPLQVVDQPRFRHRGLMIDTGRHFLPLTTIRSVIDSLPYAKLNVLHWHMVDDESFAFQSMSSPHLWNGAYSPAERYTQADVASIVEYARLRGVRVMVEFDMPGHAKSWCAGNPEVCPSASCLSPLNVASTKTFDLIKGLLLEVTGGQKSVPGKPSGLFPDEFLHLGGDEVNTTCWTAVPEIAAWLNERHMTAHQGYEYFVQRAAEMAIKQGRRPVQWNEVWDNFGTSLPKETIVHIWKPTSSIPQVAQAGYDLIVNLAWGVPGGWYLNYVESAWSSVYLNDPCRSVYSEELCQKHVLGGHGELWGEWVDGSDLEATLWPRLAAVAEQLWSSRSQTRESTSALPRIQNFRCLLLERGVRASPVENAKAREAPVGPSSCNGRRAADPIILA